MLHHKDAIRGSILDDIYASNDISVSVPKYKLPQGEHDPRHACRWVLDELMLDGNSRQNLATFCSTWVEPEVREIMAACLDKNMIDKDEYPQTAEIESRCVHMLADLWHSPHASNTLGCSTTGSSEAAMLAGMALKARWRAARKAQAKPTDQPNLVTGPVQVCWHKFCRYWDVELRELPIEPGRYVLSPAQAVARCDENTIGVVATLGTTFTGHYDPIKELSNALDVLQNDAGLNIPMHVDAASGGFVAPFLEPDLEWDFRLPRVKSINTSGHKFGLAPLGVGWVIWRDKEDLPDELVFKVNYLGGDMPTFALNFSRPGGQIVAQYYNFLRLGREGYRKVQESSRSVAKHLAEKIAAIGPFEVVHDGSQGIPAVCWKLREKGELAFSLFDLGDRLQCRGWQVPTYTLPANCETTAIQRAVVRHGVSRDLADGLVADMKRSVAYLAEHPTGSNESGAGRNGFRHT
jgi:glutamate decarboxylase